jgi:hypothetical protein
MELVGHKVVLRAYGIGGNYDIRLIDVEGVLDDAMIEEILALKEPPPLELLPIAHYGSYSACTDDLLPSDIQYFGGKAANFGILRKAIPENSPVSVALSFALWSEFLGQKLFGGRTLREEIDARLEPYIQPPINPVALSAVLGGMTHRSRRLLTFCKIISTNSIRSRRSAFAAPRIWKTASSLQVPDYTIATVDAWPTSWIWTIQGLAVATLRSQTNAGSSELSARYSPAFTTTTPSSNVCDTMLMNTK